MKRPIKKKSAEVSENENTEDEEEERAYHIPQFQQRLSRVDEE